MRAVFTAILAALLVTAGVSAAQASTKNLPWSTCTPLATRYFGQYRVDDGGADGPLCIETTSGHNLIIQSAYHGTGIAYPDIRTGRFYSSRDAASRLPVQVADPTWITLGLTDRGSAPGSWLADVDAWFYPTHQIHGHGADELVIVTRSHDWGGACPRLLRVSGLLFCADRHLTGSDGLSWPLVVLRLVPERTRVRIVLGRVLRSLAAWGWLSRSVWLGSIAYGAELGPGAGRGLRLSMRAYVEGYPMVGPL